MKILIVECGALFSIALKTIVSTESDFELIDASDSGHAALAAVNMKGFDVVETLGLHLLWRTRSRRR